MKSTSLLSRSCSLLPLITLLPATLFAAGGTWTQTTSGGLWSDTGNWSGGTVADGSGFTADFNTLDISTDNTVHLDGDRTLTNLTFGDTATGTAASWILDNNGTSTNNLILAGTTPTITVNALGSGATTTISAIIEGSAGLAKVGAGTLILSGANTFTGGVALTGTSGTLIATNSASFGTGTKTVSVQNGAAVLKFDASGGDIDLPSTISFNSSGLQTGGAIVNMAGNTTIRGQINLNSGATGTAIQVDGGSLTITGNINKAANLTRGLSLRGAGDGTISGNILSNVNGALDKTDSGTWTLSGTNAYSSTTTVSAGTLKINGGSIASSDVTVNGGVLSSGSTGTIGKSVTVNTGATLAAGGVGSVGTATVANNLNFSSGSIFDWDLTTGAADGTYDTVSVTNTLTITSGAMFNVVSSTAFSDPFWNASHTWSDIFGSKAIDNFLPGNFLYSGSVTAPVTEGSFTVSGNNLTWTAVPEPTSALAGLLIGAGLLRRRRCNGQVARG